MDTVVIDIFDDVAKARYHQRLVIVLINLTLKWLKAVVCGIGTSSSVFTFLSDMFHRHGLPEVLISDNGPN